MRSAKRAHIRVEISAKAGLFHLHLATNSLRSSSAKLDSSGTILRKALEGAVFALSGLKPQKSDLMNQKNSNPAKIIGLFILSFIDLRGASGHQGIWSLRSSLFNL